MDIQQISCIVTTFYKNIKNHWNTPTSYKHTGYHQNPTGQCCVTSLVFQEWFFTKYNQDCIVWYGTAATKHDSNHEISHCWNEIIVDGTTYCIDITVHQFDIDRTTSLIFEYKHSPLIYRKHTLKHFLSIDHNETRRRYLLLKNKFSTYK